LRRQVDGGLLLQFHVIHDHGNVDFVVVRHLVEPGGGLNDSDRWLVIVVNISVVVVDDVGGGQIGLNECTQKIWQRSRSTKIYTI